MSVVSLDDHRRIWATSKASCGSCGHRWVAVWDASDDAKDHGWECPGCGQMTGCEVERVKR